MTQQEALEDTGEDTGIRKLRWKAPRKNASKCYVEY